MPAILGTAGHIDHGKTALVRALTGQDTDRLKEEKERGISIDLGFAWLDLANGARVGIVDVPGHERFIRNMLAGAHGIDVVLLVVAADDGVMPQTEEHFEIVHLLGVERGIAVLTKADLVPASRLREVADEVAALSVGTRLSGMPAIPVSSVSGAGLAELRGEIERQIAGARQRDDRGPFRLAVDRAFVLRGHGVIVTGTASSGRVREGDILRLLPGGEECRVRSVQVHAADVAEGVVGQRVAVNLVGVEKTDVGRGHVLADRRFQRATQRLDAVVEIRPSAGRGLKNQSLVRLHHGTAAVRARLHRLDGIAELGVRQRGFVQLVLDEEIAAVAGDRFILRDETASRTIGGGIVLQPLAQRHRRGDGAAAWLAGIESAGDLPSRLQALLQSHGENATEIDWLLQILAAPAEDVVAALRAHPRLMLLPSPANPEAVATTDAIAALEQALVAHLDEVHRRAPLEPGAEMESVRSGVAPDLGPKLFRALVDGFAARGVLARDDSVLRLPSHTVALAAPERELADRVAAVLGAGGWTPPDRKQLESGLHVAPRRLTEVLIQLEREGRVVRVAQEMWFAAAAVASAREALTAHLNVHGEISAAVFRDLIQASRKFSIALLDYFDRVGFTLRVGDLRKLRRRA